jgi:hypothetical protein
MRKRETKEIYKMMRIGGGGEGRRLVKIYQERAGASIAVPLYATLIFRSFFA